MRSRRKLLLGAGAMLAMATFAGAEPAQEGKVVERPFLFSCGRMLSVWVNKPRSYDLQCWDLMAKAGVKMTGCGLCWSDAERERGKYDWDYSDFQVREIRKRGMEPSFFLGLTPDWAKLHPNLNAHQTPPREDCAEAFTNFHRLVAERYKGKVKYYTFWNEPNGCSWINGCGNGDSYPLYTKWLIRCSKAIKGVDPDAKIIAGNLDYHDGVRDGWKYVEGMYECGAGPHIDGIAIHPYGKPLHWQAIKDVRRVMVEHGDEEKGIWLTEYGWNYGNEEEKARLLEEVLTELKKPEWSFVVQASYLVLNDGPGVEKYGLTDADLNPRPAYEALKRLDKQWPGAAAADAAR